MAAPQWHRPCSVPVAAGPAPVRPRSARVSSSGVRRPAPAGQRRSIMTSTRVPAVEWLQVRLAASDGSLQVLVNHLVAVELHNDY